MKISEMEDCIKSFFRTLGLGVTVYGKLTLTDLIQQEEVYSIQPQSLFREDFDFEAPDFQISPVKTDNLYKTGQIWLDIHSQEIYLYLGKRSDNPQKDVLLILRGEKDEIGLVVDMIIGPESQTFLTKRLFPL